MRSSRMGTEPSVSWTEVPPCFTPCRARITPQTFHILPSPLRTSDAGTSVLDGEIVALDARGRASFQELQNRRTSRQPIVFYVFDVLHFNGRDTLDLTLDERRGLLDELGAHFSDPLRVNPLFRTDLP